MPIIKPGSPEFNGAGGRSMPPVDPRPVVALGVPSGDMVHADFMMALIQMLWASQSGARTMVLNFKGSAISFSRNMIVEMALASSVPVDYLMFVDSDMVFPPETLLRLLQSGRPIVGATYARRKEPFEALGRLKATGRDISLGGLHEADALPAGMLLVKMGVFRQVKKPWFVETYDYDKEPWFASEDYGFCAKAKAAGIPMWCDLTLSTAIGHIGQHAVKIPPLATEKQALVSEGLANA